MMSGFGVIGFRCGRCGHTLTGKLKPEFDGQFRKVGAERWGDILRNPDSFRLFGCLDCGAESPNLADITAITPELELKQVLQRKASLERGIAQYEEAIPKWKEDLAALELRLPELMSKVGES